MNVLTVDQIVSTTLVLLAIGVVLISSLFLVPGKREAARDTFQALLSMLVVTLTTLGVFWGGTYTLLPFLLLLAFRTAQEAGQVLWTAERGLNLGVGTALLVLPVLLWPPLTYGVPGLWLLLFARRISVPASTGTSLGHLTDLFLYPILPVILLASAAMDPVLRPTMLLLYVVVELFDSMAYATGKFLGRTPAFPVLSPRKTIEGLAGGAICILLIALGTAWVVGLPLVPAALVTTVACAVGVAGDLTASRIKRAAGVKDYPAVLKKQGGALDIWDSWIAAGAAVSVLLMLRDLL